MTYFGLSGARLTEAVVKTGPGCLDQATLMGILGPEVCPRVYGPVRDPVLGDGYAMEKLAKLDCADNMEQVLATMVKRLSVWVWCRPARVSHAYGWTYELASWLGDQGDVGVRLANHFLGMNVRPMRYSLIHGDPTLANVLWTDEGQLRIGDPIWAGGKVPSSPDVDRGKMLQSAIGWEHQLAQHFSVPNLTRCAAAVLSGCSAEESRRAWFWCAVHCLRLVPYAEKAGQKHLVDWGREQAALILESRCA